MASDVAVRCLPTGIGRSPSISSALISVVAVGRTELWGQNGSSKAEETLVCKSGPACRCLQNPVLCTIVHVLGHEIQRPVVAPHGVEGRRTVLGVELQIHGNESA